MDQKRKRTASSNVPLAENLVFLLSSAKDSAAGTGIRKHIDGLDGNSLVFLHSSYFQTPYK
jgi:hypothetical protein